MIDSVFTFTVFCRGSIFFPPVLLRLFDRPVQEFVIINLLIQLIQFTKISAMEGNVSLLIKELVELANRFSKQASGFGLDCAGFIMLAYAACYFFKIIHFAFLLLPCCSSIPCSFNFTIILEMVRFDTPSFSAY